MYIFLEVEVSLIVDQSETNVVEQDVGQNFIISGCFSAQIDPPLQRDAFFDFSISPFSTAFEFVDYIVAGGNNFVGGSLIVPSGTFGSFSTCVDVIILGDAEVEPVEVAIFNLVARSECDQVVFPDSDDSLQITIFDNDGKLREVISY